MQQANDAQFEDLALLQESVSELARDPESALSSLLDRLIQATGASEGALFSCDRIDHLTLASGTESHALRVSAVASFTSGEWIDATSCISAKRVQSGDTHLGAVALKFGNTWDLPDWRAFASFLPLFSIALQQTQWRDNAQQAAEQMEQRIREISKVYEISEAMTSTLNLDEILTQVADSIVAVVHFDRCRIYLSDPDTGRFSARTVRGFETLPEEKQEANIGLGEGVIGLVAEKKMPMLVDNIADESSAVRHYASALGIASFFALPILIRGRSIGVVVVSNRDNRPITSSGMELLATFVQQAGIGIENARFYASQERRYTELTTLYDISRTLAAASGVQNAAEKVTNLAVKITDSDASLLLMFDDDQSALRPVHWCGIASPLDNQLQAMAEPVPVPATTRLLRMPRVVSIQETENMLGPGWKSICEGLIEATHVAALVPLVVANSAIGFLLLGKHTGHYGVEELKLIAIASSQAAIVLNNASSYDRRIVQREHELSTIYVLMERVRSATTLDDALDSILNIVTSLVETDSSSLLTLDEGGSTLTVRAARGARSTESIGSDTLPVEGDSIAARAFRERRAVMISSDEPALAGVRTADQTSNGSGGSRMAIPLVVDEEPIGVLVMENRSRDAFTDEHVMMLHLVASQAATIYREMNSYRTLTRYTEDILRSIAAGVITIDKTGHIATWNARAEQIVNIQAHQMVGKHYRELIGALVLRESVREETMGMVQLIMETGKVFTYNQLNYHPPHGPEIYVNLSASQLKSESGEHLGLVVIFEDITSEVQMKEEVERISKLAETGELAANIAHELRNPLASIKGAAQWLRKELPEDFVEQHGEFLDIIIEEANGLNRITSEFLEFSRAMPAEMRSTNLNTLVGRMLQFMATYLNDHRVTVTQSLEPLIPDIMVDKTQIEQVVKNIVINAAQAMPNGGTLTITTRLLEARQFAEIAFTDTGVGIHSDKLEKIWTPFFTTKTKGTGLGLAIARKIVETHDGRLTARSAPGEGSTFVIHLPINHLQTTLIRQDSAEIADRRSDQPGDIFKMSS